MADVKKGRPPLEHGKKEIQLNLRLDAETLDLLNRCAAALNVSRGTVIRDAIRRVAAEQGIK